ncbi:universal stress protein [Methylobacterium nodulans]|uniref:UspA domain protein n=1 Tax=Methylobacterium nodulans (strain LMG 21967 / CNCM I-2342 / ORS 2060) TaxID=460265 RepID=B8IWI4_METNO|nr:universal stress protein [Methylobacterium nodulans]ACL62774.1 UspA domain protein [Methylobacterium nodulans ORS 2060]
MIASIKSVLIGVTEAIGTQEPSAALAYGFSLALQAEAHVTVHAMTVDIVVPNAWISGFAASLVAAENRRLRSLAAAAAERARADASAAGLRCTTRARHLTANELFGSLAAQARIHDVTVLDAEPNFVAARRGLIEDLILYCGRPLLVVPPAAEAFTAERIVVAWDGSAPAARAVGDALPFLRGAREVHVVTVTGEKDLSETVPGAELGPYLARHGVPVTVVDLPMEEGSVAETLRRHAILSRADLMVAGGFVHARLREMVLGGVTEALLTACPVPLLLSH